MDWTIVPRPEDGGERNQFDVDVFDQAIFDGGPGDGWVDVARPSTVWVVVE